MVEEKPLNINLTVKFAEGQLPEILRRLEQFLKIPLSFRSSTGETVIKTDYFFGPCSIIRGTEIGRLRCRKTYSSIENKLFRRKVPFVTFCYAGFLIFSVPLNLRGEMIGTMFGSQILPIKLPTRSDRENHFSGILSGLKIHDREGFFESLERVRHLEADFERVSFLQFLENLGENFIKMAFSGKTWRSFYWEMQRDFSLFDKLKGS